MKLIKQIRDFETALNDHLVIEVKMQYSLRNWRISGIAYGRELTAYGPFITDAATNFVNALEDAKQKAES